MVSLLAFALTTCKPPAETMRPTSTVLAATSTASLSSVTPVPTVIVPSTTPIPSPTPTVSPSATPTTPSPTATPSPTQPAPTVTRRPTQVAATKPPSTPTVAKEPREITLLNPPNSSRITHASTVTLKWAGGVLRLGETFQVRIVPEQVYALNKARCDNGGGKSAQYSPPLTSPEWTPANLFAPVPGQPKICPGHFEWTVYIKDAAGNIVYTSPTGFFYLYPI